MEPLSGNLEENSNETGLRPFGWKHLLLRTAIIAACSVFIGYLQLVDVLVLSSPESKLIVPTLIGFIFALLNWSYLVKIALILLPIWFATATAIAHSGLLFTEVIEMPYDQDKYWWIDWMIQFLPPLISGHWLYSGYSRMGKGISYWGWLSSVLFSFLAIFFLIKIKVSYLFLQGFYHTLICAVLCLVHFKKEKSKYLLF
jgi:hypothetical protein